MDGLFPISCGIKIYEGNILINPAKLREKGDRKMKIIKKITCLTLSFVIALGCVNICEVSAVSELSKKKVQNTAAVPTKEEVQATLAMDTFNAINAYRESKGLPRLVWNDALSTVAFKRAKETSRKFSHIRPNGSSYETLYTASGIAPLTVGESIGSGFYTGSDVLGTWLASDFHRQMIESGAYNYIAVGAFITDSGVPYIVAEFMQ